MITKICVGNKVTWNNLTGKVVKILYQGMDGLEYIPTQTPDENIKFHVSRDPPNSVRALVLVKEDYYVVNIKQLEVFTVADKIAKLVNEINERMWEIKRLVKND